MSLLDWIARIAGLEPLAPKPSAGLARQPGLPSRLFDDDAWATANLRRMGRAYQGPAFEGTKPRVPSRGFGLVDPGFVSAAEREALAILAATGRSDALRSCYTRPGWEWLAHSLQLQLEALAREAPR